ncbi:MAG: HlyD family efflux transporter periplasmic adaptor subunit [Bacteroidales bacterium]|jgi:HlyD family secretion protein
MSSEKKIEIRSEDVNDILSRPPGWILSWGTAVILSVILLILAGSAIFKYPDKLTAPVLITSENLPAQLIAKTSGRLQKVFKNEGELVSIREVVAIIENPTSYENYLDLKSVVQQFSDTLSVGGNLSNCSFIANMQFGELQNGYTQFYKSLNEYKNFLQINYHRKKIAIIKRQIEAQKSLKTLSERQVSLSKEQMEISDKIYKRDLSLFEQKVISQLEIEKSKSIQLTARQQYEAALSDLNNMKISILQAEQSVFDMELAREEQIGLLERSLMGNYDNMLADIRQWEQNYLLVSPVNGKVSFTKFWQENQNVSAGDIVFTIIPLKAAKINGKIYLPLAGAGKVKVGQKVNIKLDNYPYMEFGMVEVKVGSISMVPTDMNNNKVYIVNVSFPERLRTNYGTDLIFTEQMQGTAEIITADMSLLRRILFPFKHIFKSRL